MKTIIKLVIAAVVVNACARAGIAAMHYYQLKQAAQEAVLFGAEVSPQDIQQQILNKAIALKLPVQEKDIVVQRNGGRTWAEAAYRETVEYFPGQKHSVDLSFAVEGYSMVLAPTSGKPSRS
jgi:hypothetical protein